MSDCLRCGGRLTVTDSGFEHDGGTLPMLWCEPCGRPIRLLFAGVRPVTKLRRGDLNRALRASRRAKLRAA